MHQSQHAIHALLHYVAYARRVAVSVRDFVRETINRNPVTRNIFVALCAPFAMRLFAINVIRRAKTGHSSAPKTGHHVGGIGWKNRLIRSYWQGA
jgi:hypothetical protein